MSIRTNDEILLKTPVGIIAPCRCHFKPIDKLRINSALLILLFYAHLPQALSYSFNW